MPKFTIHLAPAEKKKRRRMWYLQIATLVCFLLLCVFSKENHRLSSAGIFVVMAINLCFVIYTELRDMGKIKYVEIGDETVQWRIYDKNMPHVSVDWNDVHWIKKESNGHLGFFMASSFCHSLPITGLLPEDQHRLIELVTQYAQQRNIRLVNFSETSLAEA